MADRGIKEIRKPRRAKGTVVGRYRNYFALGVIAAGTLCGVLYHFSPLGRIGRDVVANRRFDFTEEFRDKRAMMTLLPGEKASTIQKRLEDNKCGE